MARLSTAADRLNLLLDWLNDDDWERSARRWRDKELPHRISRFLASFDGSEEAGCVRAEAADDLHAFFTPVPPLGTENIDDYEVLHTLLVDLLRRGFPNAEPFLPERLSLASLQFAIERRAPARPRGREQRRLAKRPGAYVLRVAGGALDLVTWLVMFLLTLPGTVLLGCCAAPRSYSTERCGRFFVLGGPGRPREFCSDTCRQRRYWEGDREIHKRRAAVRRRKQRTRRHGETSRRVD